MKKSETRQHLSNGMKKSLEKRGGFSKEHLEKIRESNHKYYLEHYKPLGLSPFNRSPATRNIACYCILESGEKYEFNSIQDATHWWFDNFHPFGDKYIQCTLQRKIEQSMFEHKITYGANKRKVYITNI